MTKKKMIEKILGTWPREIVRSGFTVLGIYAFYAWGGEAAAQQSAGEKVAGCVSMLDKVGLTANQVLALVMIFVLGNGIAFAMKLAEVWRAKRAGG